MKNLIKTLFALALVLVSLNASAQKFTGKYWLYSGYSSPEYDSSGYIEKVNNMFQGSKLYFDTDGDLEIYFQDGKSYIFEYEWKSDTNVLMLNFTGKNTKDEHIAFLQYYSYRCYVSSGDFLVLDFLSPTSSGLIDSNAKAKFVLSFRKK
ncbi:hypothetical protein AD998_13390 [bacterium 336/3]|nr:hypothetical protein AD998_13390 [bacterium 336/3]